MFKSTLCYLKKNGSILMLYRNKKANDPCAGKWVGIGGKFEPGENGDECVLREVREETGLTLKKYTFHGIIHFISDVLEAEDMYLYSADEWDGDDTFQTSDEAPKGPVTDTERVSFACNEGTLMWIPEREVLKLNLWEGDPYFLKPLIEGRKAINMTCRYQGDRLVECYE